MAETTQKSILELLSEYKWGEDFTCTKCGGHKFRVDKNTLARICTTGKNCYEESVIKFTALEGLRFPIETAYGMIVYLVDSVNFDYDAKTTFVTTRNPRKITQLPLDNIIGTDDGIALSMNEILAMVHRGEMSSANADEFYKPFLSENLPTVSKMAKQFEIEQNTVSKFIERIDARIPLDSQNIETSAMDRVIDYLLTYKPDLDHILGMLMIPLDERWSHGEAVIDNKRYKIRKPVLGSEKVGVRWRKVEII